MPRINRGSDAHESEADTAWVARIFLHSDLYDGFALLNIKFDGAERSLLIFVAVSHQIVDDIIGVTEAEANNMRVVKVDLDTGEILILSHVVHAPVLVLFTKLRALHSIIHDEADASEPFTN